MTGLPGLRRVVPLRWTGAGPCSRCMKTRKTRALAGVAVITYLNWNRPARQARAAAARARAEVAEAAPAGNPRANPPGPRRGMLPIMVALGVCAIMECLFATTYMSAGHAPKATDLPFGAVGSSPVLTAAEKTISLKVTRYPNEQAAKTAIDQAQIWGALITSGTSSTLIVVPSISDLAPLDLAVRFEDAAKSAGQKLTVQQYAPVPLAAKDPFGLVQGLMLIPLLIGGYMSATLLMAATGKAAGRWRAAQLAGFAVAGGPGRRPDRVLLAAGIRQQQVLDRVAHLLADHRRGRLRRRGLAEADRGRGHAADHHRGHLVRQPLLRRGQRGAVPARPSGGTSGRTCRPATATSCCTTRSTSTATEPPRP